MVSNDSLVSDSSSSSRKKIVVYTSNGCHKCGVLKNWLTAAQRHFEERSLEDVNVMAELVMRDIVVLSAPVLEVERSIYVETEFFEGNALAVDKLQGILEGNSDGGRC